MTRHARTQHLAEQAASWPRRGAVHRQRRLHGAGEGLYASQEQVQGLSNHRSQAHVQAYEQEQALGLPRTPQKQEQEPASQAQEQEQEQEPASQAQEQEQEN